MMQSSPNPIPEPIAVNCTYEPRRHSLRLQRRAGTREQANRPLPQIAVTPEKVRVLMTEGKGLEIDWADGHKSAWGFAWLRDACPCATCVDERAQQGRKPGQPSPSPPLCCPCIRRRQSRPARTPWAATPSSSTGRTATPAESTRGSICAACASARSARLPRRRQPARRIEGQDQKSPPPNVQVEHNDGCHQTVDAEQYQRPSSSQLLSHFSAISPARKAKTMPSRLIDHGRMQVDRRSGQASQHGGSSAIAAPLCLSAAGVRITASAKLKRSARSLLAPVNMPVEMVAPEREKPRNGRHSPWTRPSSRPAAW